MSKKDIKNEEQLNILKVYEQIKCCYENNIDIDKIKDLIQYDISLFLKGKESTFVKCEEDIEAADKAIEFLSAKIDYANAFDEIKDNFYDKCTDRKNEYENALKDGVSLTNLIELINYDEDVYLMNTENDYYYQQSSIENHTDRKAKDLALSLIIKETIN